MQRFKLISATAIALVLSLILAASVAASNQSSNPSNLSAAICGDAVCLDWTPGNRDFTYQTVLFWEGSDLLDRNSGGRRTVDANTGQVQVPLDALDIAPSANGDTVAYSFQVVGFEYNPNGVPAKGNSNQVTLHLPRPPAANPAISGLSAEICGQAICLSWTPGAADYTYQEIKYWAAGDPANLSARGSRIVLPDVARTDIQIIHLNRSPGHSGAASYTFQAVGITGEFGSFDYSGYSNEVDLNIPAHLMERPDHNDKKGKGGKGGNK